jgi:hypothetical protein
LPRLQKECLCFGGHRQRINAFISMSHFHDLLLLGDFASWRFSSNFFRWPDSMTAGRSVLGGASPGIIQPFRTFAPGTCRQCAFGRALT